VTDAPALAAEKAALRAQALQTRATLVHPAAGPALAQAVLHHCPPPQGALVAGFWPMGDEIDICPLI